MKKAELRKQSAAFQIGYAAGNDYRANAWLDGDNIEETANVNAVAAFDSPDSRLDYRLGFLRACNL